MRLLLASNNQKKLAELQHLFAELPIALVLPTEIGGVPAVIEDAPTFAGNAEKKAVSAARARECWTLADDSGLSVDALAGAPGVHSARFAGVHGDDDANNRLLLEKLANLPSFLRGAHFTCALALARPDGTLAATIEARAHGRIIHQPRGTHDFGYDPLFEFTEPGFTATGRSFAELGPDYQSEVSHRGRALRELLRRLPRVLSEA
ncbi:MAG: non-canonical purine NTP pyrophosphatase [Planctomycetes bacterium]|nr:non-canonical purine NTP pyrophosphatase [Planctomycetota bacterium]